jgi:hypothetical protein
MASFWYTRAMTKMLSQSTAFNLNESSVKVGLSLAGHVPDHDDTFVDNGDADDYQSNEGTDGGGTPHSGGFGGTLRVALASKTITDDLTGDRTVFDAADTVWTAYDPTAAVSHATIMRELTNDTASPVIINLDFAAVDPGDNNFTLQYHADGIGYVDMT